jgi:hypothetical protein
VLRVQNNRSFRRGIRRLHEAESAQPDLDSLLRKAFFPRPLKRVQMQGAARSEARGVLSMYVAAPRERGNAADGAFSAAF